MKKVLNLCLSILLIFTLSACSSNENDPTQTAQPQQSSKDEENHKNTSNGKTLIAYFSLIDTVPENADASTYATPSIGNTESVAMEIQQQVGGDLFEIKTVENYPASHQEASKIAEDEMRSDSRPELTSHVENMDSYDTIYLGYPIWWYIEPMAIRTFLEEYDFSGKTILPFCTSLGAGIEESVDNISSLANGATVLNGITIRTEREDNERAILNWLSEIGMK